LAYQALGVNIVGVADPRAERRAEIAARYRLVTYECAESLLRAAKPNIVCILTPASTHRQMTELCAAAGAHVLCEKPMAVTIEDAHAMAEACRRAGVEFFYGSSYRYLPAMIEARRLIAAGGIGDVRLLTEQMIGGQGSDRYVAMSAAHYPVGGPGGGGYGLVDHGIHLIDVFPWLCHSRITRISGRGDRTGTAPRPEFAVMTLECGALASLIYDGSTFSTELPGEGAYSEARQWLDGRGWTGETGQWEASPGTLHLYGGSGSLRILPYANKLYMNDRQGSRELQLGGGTTPWHFGAQLTAFFDSIASQTPPPTSADDGLRALEALLAVYASEKSGGWESVSPWR
jgi:UDP-N-acetyl-2-amino-2-deoxyglucuronate dehydrogenase